MREELQITLLVIGVVFIIGVLVHGFWTTRKKIKIDSPSNFQSRGKEPQFNSRSDQDELVDDLDDSDDMIYDDVVISSARVIQDPNYKDRFSDDLADNKSFADANKMGSESNVEELNLSDSELDIDNVKTNDADIDTSDQTQREHANDLTDSNDGFDSASENVKVSDEQPSEDEKKPLYSSVVTQPKPEFTRVKLDNDDSVPAPPGFLLKKQSESVSVSTDDLSTTASGVNELTSETNTSNDSSSKNAEPSTEDKSQVTKPDASELPGSKLEPVIRDDFSSSKDTQQVTKPEELDDFSLDMQTNEMLAKANSGSTSKAKPADNKSEEGFSLRESARRLVRRNKKSVGEKIRKEPKISASDRKEDQLSMFDDEPKIQESQNEESSSNSDAPQSDVLVLNVQTGTDDPISGAALLPMLLTLGFKFGEHDIFHRHVNTNGKGPILFSLTNLFKPGVFDVDNMEHFTTQGVSLFMMLPIEGDAQQVFNMMHNAARKIAEEFNGKILDAKRVPISKQSLQQYAERIREFERRRLSRQ